MIQLKLTIVIQNNQHGVGRGGIKRGLTSSDIKINGELLGRGAHIYGQSKEGE